MVTMSAKQEIIMGISYNSHSQVTALALPIIFASASRNFWIRGRSEQRKAHYLVNPSNTLCLRNPLDRPAWKGVEGFLKMIPSPPWSMISWNIFSRWFVPWHNVYAATWMNRWFFPVSSCAILCVIVGLHNRLNEGIQPYVLNCWYRSE